MIARERHREREHRGDGALRGIRIVLVALMLWVPTRRDWCRVLLLLLMVLVIHPCYKIWKKKRKKGS